MFNKISAVGLLAVLMLITGCALLNPPSPLQEKTYEEKLLEVAKRVPEFGGLFLKRRMEDNYKRSLYVYLLDPTKKPKVKAAIRAVDRNFLPYQIDIYALQAQYSFLQLQEWRDRIVAEKIQWISQVIADATTNRVVVWLEKGEKQGVVAQELDRLGIPRDAVLLVARFTKYTGLGRRLEVPSRVRVGERVKLKLNVQNLSGYTLYLPMHAMPSYNFAVTQLDGAEVWCRFGALMEGDPRCEPWSPDTIPFEPKILEPDEALEFTAEWDQHDYNGNSVPPGTYWVRGIVAIGRWSGERLEIEPKPLVIER